jgi:Ni,Fe-hydrogenase III large subunit
MTALDHVSPAAWRNTITAALDAGERFGGAWATRHDGFVAWHALLVADLEQRVVRCDVGDGPVETIVDLVEAADWDEREARDLCGLEFERHSPLRALVTHAEQPERWMTPVTGAGVHQVAVGPIHAGVIESGHFRFHVVGERILAVDPRLFYKHRGLERAAERREIHEALAYVQRACAACAVANTVAYCQAVEAALGLWPDRALRAGRTALLELERLYNHLHDIGAICAGVGYAPGAMAFAALKDRAQEIIAAAFGHRFMFGTIALCGSDVDFSTPKREATHGALRDLRVDTAAGWRELEFAVSLQARLGGVGVLQRDDALRLGCVGPAARAAGVDDDLRSSSPRLAYEDFKPASVSGSEGDVAARLRLRPVELETTFDLLETLFAEPLARGTTAATATSAPLGVGRVESPRGATTCVVELADRRVRRVHLRTGSYANWPALAHASAGNLLPDFPLINKSFELCYACVDR